jgi:hypothetical protein
MAEIHYGFEPISHSFHPQEEDASRSLVNRVSASLAEHAENGASSSPQLSASPVEMDPNI